MEFEGQQVSSSLQDSFQYSGRSQKVCCLDDLHSSFNIQVIRPLNNPWVTAPKAPIRIDIIIIFIFHIFFSIPKQGLGTYPSFRFLSVLFCGQPIQQSSQSFKFSLFCWLL